MFNTSCKNNTTKNVNQVENITPKVIDKKVFLIGNGAWQKQTIIELIENSKLKEGGYVVILGLNNNKTDSSGYFLKREFIEQNIMAVHILNFKPEMMLKKTDILAIENANLICILHGNKKRLLRIREDTVLQHAVVEAYNNGTTIAGVGNGASVLGEKLFINYIIENKPGDKRITELKLIDGLGIVKKAIIDDEDFVKYNTELIKEIVYKRNFTFIGLIYQSAVLIKDNGAMAFGKVLLFKPKNAKSPEEIKKELLNKGDEFV